MATEPVRRLHAGLRRKLGPALADDVITVLAPLERDELATRSDIAGVKGDIARLEGEIAGLRGEIKAQTGLLLSVLIPIMVGLAGLVCVVVTFAR